MSPSSTPSRRPSSARAARSAAVRTLSHAERLSASRPAHADAALLAVCSDWGVLHRRITRLFEGVASLADEEERSCAYAALLDDAHGLLIRIATARASTLDGHRARAAAFLAWDEGDLIGRARRAGIAEDRVLAALLLDLVVG
jgi:hypothetical protein